MPVFSPKYFSVKTANPQQNLIKDYIEGNLVEFYCDHGLKPCSSKSKYQPMKTSKYSSSQGLKNRSSLIEE